MRWPGRFMSRQFVPALDVSENDDEFVVKAELPGIDPKEVDINLTGDLLTIKGDKKDEKEEKGENFHTIERSYGSFSRSFQLPCDVQEDKIEAHYKDGVLDLRLPKAENAKRKSVKIKVNTQ
jgi:HSP20 family protein